MATDIPTALSPEALSTDPPTEGAPPKKAHIISLGCPKNLVDTERYVAMLRDQDYTLTQSEEEADLLLVNTCGFIDNAKMESIDTILELAETKRPNQKLVVAGCLVDRYPKELKEELPEVDLWVDLEHIPAMPEAVAELSEASPPSSFLPLRAAADARKGEIQWASFPRVVLTPSHTVYLKISEGCDHSCGFCAIPSFKGKQRSVPMHVLIEEARTLVQSGAKELTLIGQDTVAYGRDLDPTRTLGLRNLLEELDAIEGLEWLRVLYTYPTRLADELEWAYGHLRTMLPYLDLPLQHLSDPVLERMRRGTPFDKIRDHIQRLRDRVPELTLRSTCIVGFPGETEEDFNLLIERFADIEVDHLGVFRYSDEEGTQAGGLPDKVDPDVANERLDIMTEWAAQHCQARAEGRLRRPARVIVDRPCLPPIEVFPDLLPAGKWWQGRSAAQAPEIDGAVFFCSEDCSEGDFVEVRLEEASYPDYLGTPARSLNR